MKFIGALIGPALAALAAQATGISLGGHEILVDRESAGLQEIVTYDSKSLMVHGERLFIFSGEFHPYRLPVPDLWLDVFQKVKALGFNTVSFYVHWALLEGERGVYRANGIFDFEPFFAAAQAAGIYLIARPGPYINAESSGGGFPGWLQRLDGQLRTRAPDFLAATNNYMANIGASIAAAQITNGGPVILVQAENEYTFSKSSVTGGFPDPVYFAYVKKQLRDAGVLVPLVNNDAYQAGHFAPGTVTNGSIEGNVDIYGYDSYPLGFDCANPKTWPTTSIPKNFYSDHMKKNPLTPNLISEFQGGSFDPWGGLGFAKCADLLNMEFERVFYKNNFASGITLLNLYMIFGGTNWGNNGHPGGYTSYDYGSVITENREIHREKYSELKLEANFLKVTPAFLTASVGTGVVGVYSTSEIIFTTPLMGNGSMTNFYIVRHSDYQTRDAATYKLIVTTSKGKFSIPQLNGSLTLNGRDSKWHVTDYDMDGTTLLYSTAEIFTWKNFGTQTVLVVYSGPNEQHELAIVSNSTSEILEGSAVNFQNKDGAAIINWATEPTRRVVQVGNTFVYILDRNSAYNYWVLDFVRDDIWGAYSSNIGNTTSVIIEAGYLIRSVSLEESTLNIYGDLNATVPIKVIGAPAAITNLKFNGQALNLTVDPITGEWSSTLVYIVPQIILPDLSRLNWKYVDNLPEVQNTYDDHAWTAAIRNSTSNPTKLKTPVSLYGSDYGYNTGILIYRGLFTARGDEKTFEVYTQGGSAYGSSVWINSTYLGSWGGIDNSSNHNDSYTLPSLITGSTYIITVLVDNNGLEENFAIGPDQMKLPRGILDYTLSGHAKIDMTWKLTGNFGGESYVDKTRGPLNEGGLWAERQGFTQPHPPNEDWISGDPMTGLDGAGVAFYQSDFMLDLPENYDIPLNFMFDNTTINGVVAQYRAQLWVNGYQFGKYVNHIGPQCAFPVPQGVLDYHGQNWIAIELWAQQATGARLSNFRLTTGTIASTSLKKPATVPIPSYSKRDGVY